MGNGNVGERYCVHLRHRNTDVLVGQEQ